MKKISMIIVTMPGTWQKILQNNIASHPSVEVVGIVHGGISAIKMAKEHAPDLLLIDASIPIQEATALIENIRLGNTGTQCLVLADTHRQRRMAARAGAQYTLSSFNYSTEIGQIFADLRADSASAASTSRDDSRETILDGE
jgi:chemotaxis response regulator CheB